MSIGKPINDKLVSAARGTKNEIIGLLIGRLQDNTIIIEDSVTGESSAEPHRAILSSNALAKIADELVTGRIKGNIVGWYHSHTHGGLFFSETDIATQRKLQQFSTLIAGMVVDASNGDVGFFRVEPQSGQAVRVPTERITVYAERSEAIPPQARAKTLASPPRAEVRRPTPSQIRTLGLLGAVGPIVYVAAVVIGGFLWPGYSHYSQTVSSLTSARAPNQAIMLPLFAFYNVCVILLAVGLYYGIQKEVKHVWGPVFLTATGAGGLVLFLFPQDYPQGPVTIFGTLHVVVAGIITFFSLAAMALFWHHFRLDPSWKGYGRFSIVMLPIALVLGVFGVISLSTPYAGLAERLSTGSILLWMETVSIGLVLRSSKNTAS